MQIDYIIQTKEDDKHSSSEAIKERNESISWFYFVSSIQLSHR